LGRVKTLLPWGIFAIKRCLLVKAPHHSCHTSSPIGHQNTHENSQALENTPYYQEKKSGRERQKRRPELMG
jgi:hypothetical protein